MKKPQSFLLWSVWKSNFDVTLFVKFSIKGRAGFLQRLLFRCRFYMFLIFSHHINGSQKSIPTYNVAVKVTYAMTFGKRGILAYLSLSYVDLSPSERRFLFSLSFWPILSSAPFNHFLRTIVFWFNCRQKCGSFVGLNCGIFDFKTNYFRSRVFGVITDFSCLLSLILSAMLLCHNRFYLLFSHLKKIVVCFKLQLISVCLPFEHSFRWLHTCVCK